MNFQFAHISYNSGCVDWSHQHPQVRAHTHWHLLFFFLCPDIGCLFCPRSGVFSISPFFSQKKKLFLIHVYYYKYNFEKEFDFPLFFSVTHTNTWVWLLFFAFYFYCDPLRWIYPVRTFYGINSVMKKRANEKSINKCLTQYSALRTSNDSFNFYK